MPATPATIEAKQRERLAVEVYSAAQDACVELAREIAALVRRRADEGKSAVLGLATGSTPVRLYRELIRLHRGEGLDFSNVVTFNLDEYLGLAPEHPQSYHRFMREQFFDHVNVPASNIHIPDGLTPRAKVFEYCQTFEEAIASHGGIDLQILGIGRTGHIGFNEPGSGRDSRTRLVALDSMTRRDAARDFLGEANVPRFAITMGVGTILGARRVALMAWGESKADVIAKAVEEPPRDNLPASFLQGHGDVRFLIDDAAAAELTRVKHPWLVGPVDWQPRLARKAVVWLAAKLGKPVLKLLDEEYNEHGMAELLTEQGPAYDLNIRVFNELQRTISGWPGGKPGADDSSRPERAKPHPKRVLVLSPEPQDDILSMGGTLHRLVDQGHEVRVVYLTSGNLAVPDGEVRRAAELFVELGEEGGTTEAFTRKVRDQIEAKGPFDSDTPDIRLFKGRIRRSEARAACFTCGLGQDRVVFLDLPFYEQGKYRQFAPTEEDVDRLAALLETHKPHQIYLTGLRADPSSVPAVCHQIILDALGRFGKTEWLSACRVWAYRGPGKEWDIHEIDMAVPLSPDELANKIQGAYQHLSQRSQTPFAGEAGREAWRQSERCNQHTAERYDQLGLAEYEAIEAFRRPPSFAWEARSD